MNRPLASVIVRSKDKEATIAAALGSIRAQTVSAELILVDSGSTDRTLEIAAPFCDKVVEIPAERFSYGRALNIGASHAEGDVLFALSAHCLASNEMWVEHSLEAYHDTAVAATTGWTSGPDGAPLDGPTRFGLGDIGSDPFWGLSNHASSWRRDVWEQFPFNEELIACEDKEWMWRILQAGFYMVVDPRLVVGTPHRRAAGLGPLFQRVQREHLAISSLVDYSPMSLPHLLHQWWSGMPESDRRTRWRRRLSPWRATELLGGYRGDHAGARNRDSSTSTAMVFHSSPSAPSPCEVATGDVSEEDDS